MSSKRSKKPARKADGEPSLNPPPSPASAATPPPPRDAEPRFECRACGCRHLPVYYTRARPGYVLRSRKCRNCGRAMTTRERTE